jgi:hypothetical protein
VDLFAYSEQDGYWHYHGQLADGRKTRCEDKRLAVYKVSRNGDGRWHVVSVDIGVGRKPGKGYKEEEVGDGYDTEGLAEQALAALMESLRPPDMRRVENKHR